MKYYFFLLILFFPVVANAQFEGKIFKSKSNETIHFANDSSFSINFRYRHMTTKHEGEGVYKIEGNRLIAMFDINQHKDTSCYKIKQTVPSDTTSINVECVIVSSDGIKYPCEFVVWKIIDRNNKIIEKSNSPIGSVSQFSINNINAFPHDAKIVFHDSFTSDFSFTLAPNSKTEYLVILKENRIYVEKGELIFKIIKKKNKIILKLVNGKDCVGFKTMDFYLVE
jgi:hypothetical protein